MFVCTKYKIKKLEKTKEIVKIFFKKPDVIFVNVLDTIFFVVD